MNLRFCAMAVMTRAVLVLREAHEWCYLLLVGLSHELEILCHGRHDQGCFGSQGGSRMVLSLPMAQGSSNAEGSASSSSDGRGEPVNFSLIPGYSKLPCNQPNS
eukprot:s4749_g5.t1